MVCLSARLARRSWQVAGPADDDVDPCCVCVCVCVRSMCSANDSTFATLPSDSHREQSHVTCDSSRDPSLIHCCAIETYEHELLQ